MANSRNAASIQNDVLTFSQFPNLSLQEQKVMTRTACMIIKLISTKPMTCRRIEEYLLEAKNPRDENIFQPGDKLFGPNGDCAGFLRMPEIACVIFRYFIYVPRKDLTYNNYSSALDAIKQKSFFYTLRLLVILAIQYLSEQGLCDSSCGVKLIQICEYINELEDVKTNLQWVLSPTDQHVFLGNMTLPYFLVAFCARELVITFKPDDQNNVELMTCRLRNHFDYLTDQIEKERLLALETMRIFDTYCENHRDVGWDQVTAHICFYTNFSDRTWRKNTGDTFLNNVFTVLHYVPTVKNYGTLMAAISKISSTPLDETVTQYTPNTELNQLLDMTCFDSLDAISYWELPLKAKFFGILNELSTHFNNTDAEYLLDYMNLIPFHAQKIHIHLYTINKTMMYLLVATDTTCFITENQVVDYFREKCGCDVLLLLSKLGFSSIGNFIKTCGLSITSSIIVHRKNGIEYFKNLNSVLSDFDHQFPLVTKFDLLNSLEKAADSYEGGRVPEKVLFETLSSSHFHYYFASISDFFDAFDFKEVVQEKDENGEAFYRVSETFEDARESLFKEKDDQMEAVKLYRKKLTKSKIIRQDIRELSSTQIMKKHFIPYEAHVTLSTQLCVTDAFDDNDVNHSKRRFFRGPHKKRQPEPQIQKVYDERDPWDQ